MAQAPLVNHQVLLKSRPIGQVTEDNFEIVERPVPPPHEGDLLLRTLYLSLDPYMRGRMNAGRSYAEPADIGAVMVGGTVSEVVAGKNENFRAGDIVLGYEGWQEYSISGGGELRKLDPAAAPISYHLGVLGMPGMTAYVGLLDIGKPVQGETVVVSAAAGAVGSVVGQMAKIIGCRVVGVAGGKAKCRYVVEDLGFDACADHRAGSVYGELRRACPNGIDVYYDNVGGPVLEAVLRLINQGARIPLVGMISQYNATQASPGPNLMPLLVKRARIEGMIVSDHADRQAAFAADMTRWLAEGKVKYREHVVEGLVNAPSAFCGLFRGENFGKLLVKVAAPSAGGKA